VATIVRPPAAAGRSTVGSRAISVVAVCRSSMTTPRSGRFILSNPRLAGLDGFALAGVLRQFELAALVALLSGVMARTAAA